MQFFTWVVLLKLNILLQKNSHSMLLPSLIEEEEESTTKKSWVLLFNNNNIDDNSYYSWTMHDNCLPNLLVWWVPMTFFDTLNLFSLVFAIEVAS